MTKDNFFLGMIIIIQIDTQGTISSTVAILTEPASMMWQALQMELHWKVKSPSLSQDTGNSIWYYLHNRIQAELCIQTTST